MCTERDGTAWWACADPPPLLSQLRPTEQPLVFACFQLLLSPLPAYILSQFAQVTAVALQGVLA